MTSINGGAAIAVIKHGLCIKEKIKILNNAILAKITVPISLYYTQNEKKRID